MIGNNGGGGKEMVRSSGGRSFQRCGAVMDMARLENMYCIVCYTILYIDIYIALVTV